MSFRISLSNSEKKPTEIDSIDQLGEFGKLNNIKSLNLGAQDDFPFT